MGATPNPRIETVKKIADAGRRRGIFRKIANTVRAWRGEKGVEKYEDVAGFCKAVKIEEVEKNGYVLTPGRYVGVVEEEDDGVPFEVKIRKLTSELKQYFQDGEKLKKEIEEKINKILGKTL